MVVEAKEGHVRPGQTKCMQKLSELPEVILDWCLSTVRDKITGHCEGGTVNHVRWRGIKIFFGGCTKAEEDPWEFVNPVRTG